MTSSIRSIRMPQSGEVDGECQFRTVCEPFPTPKKAKARHYRAFAAMHLGGTLPAAAATATATPTAGTAAIAAATATRTAATTSAGLVLRLVDAQRTTVHGVPVQ